MQDEDIAVIISLLKDYISYVSQISAVIPISIGKGTPISDSKLVNVLQVSIEIFCKLGITKSN